MLVQWRHIVGMGFALPGGHATGQINSLVRQVSTVPANFSSLQDSARRKVSQQHNGALPCSACVRMCARVSLLVRLT